MSNITTLGASEVAVHELEVESELASLGRLRDWFTSLCDTAIEVSDRAWIDSVNLAITEATTNIIRHAYQSRHDQSIKMRVHAGDGQMTIRLLHTGTPFDGPNAPRPTFASLPAASASGSGPTGTLRRSGRSSARAWNRPATAPTQTLT